MNCLGETVNLYWKHNYISIIYFQISTTWTHLEEDCVVEEVE